MQHNAGKGCCDTTAEGDSSSGTRTKLSPPQLPPSLRLLCCAWRVERCACVGPAMPRPRHICTGTGPGTTPTRNELALPTVTSVGGSSQARIVDRRLQQLEAQRCEHSPCDLRRRERERKRMQRTARGLQHRVREPPAVGCQERTLHGHDGGERNPLNGQSVAVKGSPGSTAWPRHRQ